MPIRVVLADDHEIFLDGLTSMLQKQPDIDIVGNACNGKELISITEKLQPDIVITDIKMPGIDGIEATRVLTKKFPEIKIIGLSMFDQEGPIIEMLEAGGKGYLQKNADKNEIIEAIKAVNAHSVFYCRHTTAQFARLIIESKFSPYNDNKGPTFSEREIEIIKLLCEGYSNWEIADKLYFTKRTAENYRERIFKKMNVKNSAGLVIYAIKNKIYSIE